MLFREGTCDQEKAFYQSLKWLGIIPKSATENGITNWDE